MNQLHEQTREVLRRTTREQAEHIEALRKRVDFLTIRQRELKAELEQCRRELAARDAKAERLLDSAMRERDSEIALIDDQLRAANRTIRMMQSTRVWQLGVRYWRIRDATKRAFGRM